MEGRFIKGIRPTTRRNTDSAPTYGYPSAAKA